MFAEKVLPMKDFTLQPLLEGDIGLISGLQPPDWPDITAMHRYYFELPCAYPHKVLIDGKIAGIGCALNLNKTGWLAHIIVSETFRNRGIGRFITASLRDYLLNIHSCATVSLIASDLGYPVYEKLGFVLQCEYLTFAPSQSMRPPVLCGSIVNADPSHLTAIAQLDREISGEDRSSILAGHIHGAQLYIENNCLRAAYLRNLGEGLLIAADEQAATNLLACRLSENKWFTFPAGNIYLSEFFSRNGASKIRTVRRMIYGESFAWKPGSIYNRLGGYLG